MATTSPTTALSSVVGLLGSAAFVVEGDSEVVALLAGTGNCTRPASSSLSLSTCKGVVTEAIVEAAVLPEATGGEVEPAVVLALVVEGCVEVVVEAGSTVVVVAMLVVGGMLDIVEDGVLVVGLMVVIGALEPLEVGLEFWTIFFEMVLVWMGAAGGLPPTLVAAGEPCCALLEDVSPAIELCGLGMVGVVGDTFGCTCGCGRDDGGIATFLRDKLEARLGVDCSSGSSSSTVCTCLTSPRLYCALYL